MDRNVQKRIRATCEFSFHTSLRFPSTQKGKKIKSHLRTKEETFLESLKAEFGPKQVLNISTCGANRLPRMGNAAAAFSHRSVIFLVGFAGVCDASIRLNLTFAKISMALNKTEI